jgi:hypothetical protein
MSQQRPRRRSLRSTSRVPRHLPPSLQTTTLLIGSEPHTKSTGGVTKIGSDPNPDKLLTHSPLDVLLANETRDANFRSIAGLIEHVFPDSELPLPPEDILTYIQEYPSPGPLFVEGRWRLDLFSDDRFSTKGQEHNCSCFFNAVGALIALAGNRKEVPRIWSCYSDRALPGIRASRRPDVALFDKTHCEGFYTPKRTLQRALHPPDVPSTADPNHNWGNIVSTSQIKSSPNGITAAQSQLLQDAYFIFSSQDNRRYVLGFGFCQASAFLSLFDRSGAIHSEIFDIDTHPCLFIRLISGLVFSTPTRVGYDPTIGRLERNGTRFIRVGPDRYDLLDTVFIGDVVRGRGTVCYHVSRDGKEYAIKDIWTDSTRQHTERIFLDAAYKAGVSGVPTCITRIVVLVEGRKDSTSWARECVPPDHRSPAKRDVEIRVHERLVLQPFATPLVQFRSKTELLSALRDVIQSEYPAFKFS